MVMCLKSLPAVHGVYAGISFYITVLFVNNTVLVLNGIGTVEWNYSAALVAQREVPFCGF